MHRIHRASFVVPHEPYRLIKRFRHEEETGFEPVRWHKNIYDQDQGYILGSTPFRWLTRILYLIIFYIGICVLWFVCFCIFETTINDEQPKYYIHHAPGMSLAPHIESLNVPFIIYRDKKDVDIDPYTQDIDQFLSKYGALDEDYGNCKAEHEYGYMENKPCFFIKLNRVIGFTPKTYDRAQELPDGVPSELKAMITNLPEEERTGRIWLSCSANNEAIKFEYWPKHQSVPAKLLTIPTKLVHSAGEFYQPTDYQRIIAVQMSGISLDEKFKVHCYTWAKNIEQLDEGRGYRGSMSFTVKIKKWVHWTL